MKAKLIISLFFIAGLVFTVVKPATAATYKFQESGHNNIISPQTLTDPEDVQYVYGTLGPGTEVFDYYEFSLTEYVSDMKISLLIPDNKIDFHPGLILINPHLLSGQADLPFGLPFGYKGETVLWGDSTAGFYNHEIFQTLQVGPSITRSLTEDNYKIAIFDPDGKGGRYVLKIGVNEKEKKFMDYLNFFWAITRIHLNLY